MYGIRLGFNLWEFSIVNRKTLHYLNCVKWSRQLNSFWVNGLLCISKRLHGWVSQISPSQFKLHHLLICPLTCRLAARFWQPIMWELTQKEQPIGLFSLSGGKMIWLAESFVLFFIVQHCATLCNNIAFVNF